ncbi:hypothetical protein Trydic_g14473 [Trypoxylus dichotomus]
MEGDSLDEGDSRYDESKLRIAVSDGDVERCKLQNTCPPIEHFEYCLSVWIAGMLSAVLADCDVTVHRIIFRVGEEYVYSTRRRTEMILYAVRLGDGVLEVRYEDISF